MLPGRHPGLLEAYLHVAPARFLAQVLFAVVEVALLVLGAARVELAFAPDVRAAVASAVYDAYGAAARRRLVRSRRSVVPQAAGA